MIKAKEVCARARQLRKREQMMRQKLKQNSEPKPKGDRGREIVPSLFFRDKEQGIEIQSLAKLVLNRLKKLKLYSLLYSYFMFHNNDRGLCQ